MEKEALDEVQEKEVMDILDAIMMDVQMPEMDGFTAAKEIRKWENQNKRKPAKIYFISGEYYSMLEVKAAYKGTDQGELGMEGIFYMKKPIDVEAVRKIVSIRRNSKKD